MKKSFIFFLLIAVIFSCKNEPTIEQSKKLPPVVKVPELTAKLVCEISIDTETVLPKSEVFLEIGADKLKMGSLLNCDEITPADYQNYQIPAKALTAAGGWWAGYGDYFYVVREAGNFVVKQGVMDEQQVAADYGYRTLATFSKTGEVIFTQEQLAGTYTIGSHDEAYILVLNLTANKKLAGTLYEIDGMLPPEDEIDRFLADFKMNKFQKFDVNLDKLTFDSDFGKRKFEMTKGFESVIFTEKKWVTGAAFEMSKIGFY
ncbi:MAG: hypothetical protein ACI9XO_002200 [Paraglaciecola sp.]|jgi:hypothetical protein